MQTEDYFKEGMSDETRKAIAVHLSHFRSRVSRNNKRLANGLRRHIYSASKANRERYGQTSEHFTFTFSPDADPGRVSDTLATLQKLGVEGHALTLV